MRLTPGVTPEQGVNRTGDHQGCGGTEAWHQSASRAQHIRLGAQSSRLSGGGHPVCADTILARAGVKPIASSAPTLSGGCFCGTTFVATIGCG